MRFRNCIIFLLSVSVPICLFADSPDTSVVTADGIGGFGYAAVEDFVSRKAPFHMVDEYGRSVNFGAYGIFTPGGFRSISVRINGIPVSDSTYNSYVFSRLPSADVAERIEIVRGPVSGTKELGIINVVTVSDSGTDFSSAKTAARYGQNGACSFSALNRGKKEHFLYSLNAGVSGTDSMPDSISDSSRQHFDIFLRHKTLSAGFVFSDTEENFADEILSAEDNHVSEEKFAALSLNCRHQFSQKTSALFEAGYTGHKNIRDYGRGTDIFGRTETGSSAYFLNSYLFHKFKPDLDIRAGLKYRHVTGKSDGSMSGTDINSNIEDSFTGGFALGASYRPLSNISISAEVLSEYVSGYQVKRTENNATVPGWDISPEWFFSPWFAASYSCRDHRVSVLYKRSSLLPSFGRFLEDTDDTVRLQMLSLDYGLYYRENHITGGIFFCDTEYPASDIYTKSYGITAGYKKIFDGGIQAEGDIVLQNADFYTPDVTCYLKLTYLLPYDIKAAVTAGYVGKAESPYSETSDGRFVSDVNLSVKYGRLDISLLVTNIIDDDIRYPATPYSRWADGGTLGNGRSISCSVKFVF